MRLPLGGTSGELSAVSSKHAGQKPLSMSTSNDELQISQKVLRASRSIYFTVPAAGQAAQKRRATAGVRHPLRAGRSPSASPPVVRRWRIAAATDEYAF